MIESANRNDSVLLEPTLQTIADRGLLADIETLHLDRGYDSAATIERCQRIGLTDVICAKKRKPGEPTKTKNTKRHTPSACDGRWNAPTPGSQTSDNSAATPTDIQPSASAKSPSS